MKMGNSGQILEYHHAGGKRSAPIMNPKMTAWAWVLVIEPRRPPLRKKQDHYSCGINLAEKNKDDVERCRRCDNFRL